MFALIENATGLVVSISADQPEFTDCWHSAGERFGYLNAPASANVVAAGTMQVCDTLHADGTVTKPAYVAPPAPPVPPPLPKKITKLAFRNRFTTAEKVTLEIAALDNPAAAMPVRQQAAALRSNLADTAAATFIDLSRADTRAGVQSLEAAGLLGVGRALQILDAPIADTARYTE
jgi:hypothetical protein